MEIYLAMLAAGNIDAIVCTENNRLLAATSVKGANETRILLKGYVDVMVIKLFCVPTQSQPSSEGGRNA